MPLNTPMVAKLATHHFQLVRYYDLGLDGTVVEL